MLCAFFYALRFLNSIICLKILTNTHSSWWHWALNEPSSLKTDSNMTNLAWAFSIDTWILKKKKKHLFTFLELHVCGIGVKVERQNRSVAASASPWERVCLSLNTDSSMPSLCPPLYNETILQANAARWQAVLRKRWRLASVITTLCCCCPNEPRSREEMLSGGASRARRGRFRLWRERWAITSHL